MNHVFVTGAGFTQAFVPDAPLLVDDFDNDALVEKVIGLPAASKMLEDERRFDERGFINIERLMSRLDVLMPYDYADGAHHEYAFLLTELKQAFLRRIRNAMDSTEVSLDAMKFARHCAKLSATCVTFNYDCYLDEALYATRSWDPGWGYGFFCRPSSHTVAQDPLERVLPSETLLLKLHGSLNWRTRLGYKDPVALDSIVHHDEMSSFARTREDIELINRHLESDPVTIPPVLSKAGLITQPVLRVVWDVAFKSLSDADAVTFIGHSLPPTDTSAQTLFNEALSDLPLDAIRIIDRKRNETEKNDLKVRYREVLGDISDDHFYFDGARGWIQSLSSDQTDLASHSD